MDVTSILKEIPLKKLLALCALGVLLPQAIPLLTRLVWAIFIILIILLLIEICVIFVIKAWCPNSVSTNHVIAWTIKTFMTLGSSAFNIVLLLIYSSFDLVFGRSFLGTHRARSSRSNRADLRFAFFFTRNLVVWRGSSLNSIIPCT